MTDGSKEVADRRVIDRHYGSLDGRPISSTGGKPIDYARKISPTVLDQDRASGPIVDYNYQWFKYDDNTAEPTYDPERIRDAKTDLLYEVHTYGRGFITLDKATETQMKAAALLAAEEHTGKKIYTTAERKTIQRLADSETVYTEIDRIRDKRLKGRVSTSGPKVKRSKKKLTAAEWDGRERLIAYNSRSAVA